MKAPKDVRDVPVDGVLAENERGCDFPIRQAGGDEAQHLGLTAGEWRVALRLDVDGVGEESRERSMQLALFVCPGQVRVAGEREFVVGLET